MPGPAAFTELLSVDSTNNYAMGMVHAGMARHGMAWFAREQTAGKGQRGKTWLGKPGENIALSIALYPLKVPVSRQFALSMAVALACHDFFTGYAGDETKIKWPNDIYWRDRKAGGILIENIFSGTHWKCAIVGIGFNINQTDFDALIRNPVSLKQITGKHYDVLELAKELHQLVLRRFQEIDKKQDHLILANYNQHLFRANEPIRLKKDNIVFETVVKQVSENGQLITMDSLERRWNFGGSRVAVLSLEFRMMNYKFLYIQHSGISKVLSIQSTLLITHNS